MKEKLKYKSNKLFFKLIYLIIIFIVTNSLNILYLKADNQINDDQLIIDAPNEINENTNSV